MIETEKETFHITFSCYHRKWLFKSPVLYQKFLEQLEKCRKTHNVKLFAYVVMPNHVHIILNIEYSRIGKFLGTLKRLFAFHALRHIEVHNQDIYHSLQFNQGGRSGHHFWQPGKGSIRKIVTQKQLTKTIEYIHNNPAKSEIVNLPGEWKWSSIDFWNETGNTIVKLDRSCFG